MVLENELLYGVEHETDEKVLDPDFLVPIGKAKIEKEGTDLSIIGYGKALLKAMEAVRVLESEHGVHAEVLNLRTLKPLDREAIIETVIKTGRLLTVEEGFP